ncbi:hypothetical protein DF184_09030 [Streptococcus suis]|nr:hypothetical protein DF184_09030 [Streptococcus suis]
MTSVTQNQVLRKHVKLVNLVNVNYQRYINVSRHSRFFILGVFFCGFYGNGFYLFLADVVFIINGCLDIFYNWTVSN